MTKFLIVIASLMVVATVIAHEEQNGDHGGATHPIIWVRGARYIERYDAPTELNELYTMNGHICSVVRISGSGDSLTVTYEHPPRIVSPPRPPTPPPPPPKPTPEPPPPKPVPTPPKEEPEPDEPETEDTTETTPDAGDSDTGDSEPTAEPEHGETDTETESEPDDEGTGRDTEGYGRYQASWTIPEGLSIIHIPLQVDGVTRISHLFALLGQARFLISINPESRMFESHWPLYPFWEDRDIKSYEAFIVSMSESAEIALEGKALHINVVFREGWNLIGFPRHRQGPIRNHGTTIGYQNDAWIFDNEHAPGTGYLIESDRSFTTEYGGPPWGTPIP